jgi:hypothetical protein
MYAIINCTSSGPPTDKPTINACVTVCEFVHPYTSTGRRRAVYSVRRHAASA